MIGIILTTKLNHLWTGLDGCQSAPARSAGKEGRIMDREEYERNLKRKQDEHLKMVINQNISDWQPCMHNSCPLCHGTGIKLDRSMCVHMIACPCPKHSPGML